MKTTLKYIMFICVITAVSGFICINASASAKISIESYNKTISTGSVEAASFREALLKLCAENNINVILNSDGMEILSVNGISNNLFSVYDCWQGYIFRDGEVMQSPDILNTELLSNDILVVYYGHISDTKIVTLLNFYEKNNRINFHVSSSSVQWHESNGEWISGSVTENLENVRINITEPGGLRKIVQTNSDGIAESPLSGSGVYKFYAEGYTYGSFPSIVRTRSRIYFHSLSGNEYVTRAQACAFLVQAFDLSPKNLEKSFSDVDIQTEFANEINTAASGGLVHGFENGDFKPDESVNLLQLGIMLANLYPDDTAYDSGESTEHIEALPEWAQAAALKISNLGLFDGIGYIWMRPVTADDLSVIFSAACGTF